jgi:hypothetical protein
MALTHANITVGTTPTKIVQLPTGGPRGIAVQIQNLDTVAVFIGDATITATGATRGHSIAVNATQQLWLNGGDSVYAISAAGTSAGAVVVTYSL